MSRRQGGRQVAEDPAEAPGVSSDPAAHWLTLWPPPQAETSNTESAPLTGAKQHLDLDHLSLKSHEALGGGFEVTTERKFRKKKGRVDTKRLRIPNVSFQLSLKPALCALWLGPPYWTWGRLRAPHSPRSNFLSDTNETRPSEANGGRVGAGGPFLCPQPRDQAAPLSSGPRGGWQRHRAECSRGDNPLGMCWDRWPRPVPSSALGSGSQELADPSLLLLTSPWWGLHTCLQEGLEG